MIDTDSNDPKLLKTLGQSVAKYKHQPHWNAEVLAAELMAIETINPNNIGDYNKIANLLAERLHSFATNLIDDAELDSFNKEHQLFNMVMLLRSVYVAASMMKLTAVIPEALDIIFTDEINAIREGKKGLSKDDVTNTLNKFEKLIDDYGI